MNIADLVPIFFQQQFGLFAWFVPIAKYSTVQYFKFIAFGVDAVPFNLPSYICLPRLCLRSQLEVADV